MSVDYLDCNGPCGDNFSECSPHYYCSNCGGTVCVDCFPGEKEKFGLTDENDKEAIGQYGEESLAKCSTCKLDEEQVTITIERYNELLEIEKSYRDICKGN